MKNISRTYINRQHQLIWEAFDRIKKGNPVHSALQQKSTAGKLRVSVTSVALEAGCSRTLIGYANCRYSDIFEAISMARTKKRITDPTISNLESEVDSLHKMLKGRAATNQTIQSRLQQYLNIHPIKQNRSRPSSTQPELSPVVYEASQTKTNRIRALRDVKANLKARIKAFDAESANMLIKIRKFERGIGNDGERLKTDTYEMRLNALTLVGRK